MTGFTEDCPQCPGYSFVLRLNDSGDSLNLFTYSYSDYTKIRKIEDGYLIGASYFDTTVNYAQTLLFKINKSFELYFQKKINSDGREILKDVRVINDNKFVIAADYDTLGKRIGKIYIVDSLGNIIHRNLFDYSNWDFCLLSGVMPFDNGDIAFVGIARLLFSQNWQDIFVARTDSTLFSKPIGIKNINNFVFQDYKLYQNYPNPFNPSTKITFNIPMNAKVTLRIYDMLGKEVTRLIDQNLTVGNYSIQFDGSLFSSGVYFYSLNAEGSNGNVFSATKRMVLLK